MYNNYDDGTAHCLFNWHGTAHHYHRECFFFLLLLAVCFNCYSSFSFISFVRIYRHKQLNEDQTLLSDPGRLFWVCKVCPVSYWNYRCLYLILTALIGVWLIINISLTAHPLWTHSAIIHPENTWEKRLHAVWVLYMAIYRWTITVSLFTHQ